MSTLTLLYHQLSSMKMETFYLVIFSIITFPSILAAPTTPNTDTTTIPPITCDYSAEQCLATYNEHQCYKLPPFANQYRYPRACGDICRQGLSTYNKIKCEKYCNGFVSQNISCDQTTTTATTTTTTTPETTTSSSTVSQDMLQDDTELGRKQLSTILGIILGVVGVLFVVSFTLNIILLRRNNPFLRGKYAHVPGEDYTPRTS